MRLRENSILIVCLLSTLFIVNSSIQAQEKRLLLFSKGTTFLPQIVKVLDSMYNHDVGQKYFSSILNVNKWSINRLEEGQLEKLIRYYESTQELRKSTQAKLKRNESFVDFARQANCYMRIEVLEKLPLIEYQFLISDSLTETNSEEFKMLLTNESRFEGFTIDISKDNFIEDLRKSITSLFSGSNMSPIPMLEINSELHKDGYYHFGVGREIVLDASLSYDPDGSATELQYTWNQVSPEGKYMPVSESNWLDISSNEKVLRLNISKIGEYWFTLTLFDGTGFSDERNFKIRTHELPKIISRPTHKIVSNRSVLAKDEFVIPVEFFSLLDGPLELDIISVSKKKYKNWHDLFPITRDYNKYLVPSSQLSEKFISQECDSSNCVQKFEITVGGASNSYRSIYEFALIARNEFVESDTTRIFVDYTGNSNTFDYTLTSTLYRGVPGSQDDDVYFRNIFLGMMQTWSIGRGYSISIGQLISVHEEEHDSTLGVIDFRYFLTVNDVYSDGVVRAYLAYHFTGRYSGIGLGLNLGAVIDKKIFVEHIYFPRGWSTSSARMDLGAPNDIVAAISMVGIIVIAAIG